MPKVSIIVPVYNAEKYIRRCLDSIQAQTMTYWECILVDDGSIDKSGEICDEYAEKDSRIKVIHKKNEGVSYARIDGYNHSRGEYITFVDSDDTIVERYIEIMLKELLSKNVDVVCCQNNDINDGIISFIKKRIWDYTTKNNYASLCHETYFMTERQAYQVFHYSFVQNYIREIY